MQELMGIATGADRARLLASGSPGSGSWLHGVVCDNFYPGELSKEAHWYFKLSLCTRWQGV